MQEKAFSLVNIDLEVRMIPIAPTPLALVAVFLCLSGPAYSQNKGQIANECLLALRDGKLAGSWVIGGDVIYHKFNNFDFASVDIQATTVRARLSWQF